MSAQPEDLPEESARHPGRPSKLTRATEERFFDAIRSGAPIITACTVAGISQTTLYRWLENAQKPESDSQYREFRDRMTQVVAEAEVWHLANWSKHSKKDWRASQAWLGMRFPERYSRNRYEKENGSGPRVSRKDELTEAMSEGSRLLEAGE